ncbi:MAG: LysE/ArgO family amino acid transporter [Allorhizobium sp.]
MIVDISALHVGFLMGAASIASVGPNNLLLLREGIVGGRTLTVASLVFSSYVALVSAAVFLGSSSFRPGESLSSALSWGGLVALIYFAGLSFRAMWTHEVTQRETKDQESLLECALRVLKVVWANPLTWLELLLVPAALARSFPSDMDRIFFAVALLTMSAICCFGYALFGYLVASLVTRRGYLRVFDLVSGVILTCMSASLATSLLFS